jgi:acetyl-CoA carboxylase biotin carboxyl carrier protein
VENRQIKELMTAMQRTGTKRLVLRREGTELELEREENASKVVEPTVDLIDENPLKEEMALHRANRMLSRGGEMPPALGSTQGTHKSLELDGNSTYVSSPMVGTYYAAASAEDPSYVKVGDRIEKDTVVCIVEAMKVMNEVKAGVAGIVAEVLVQNSHPVEFGTKLFRITQPAS